MFTHFYSFKIYVEYWRIVNVYISTFDFTIFVYLYGLKIANINVQFFG